MPKGGALPRRRAPSTHTMKVWYAGEARDGEGNMAFTTYDDSNVDRIAWTRMMRNEFV